MSEVGASIFVSQKQAVVLGSSRIGSVGQPGKVTYLNSCVRFHKNR